MTRTITARSRLTASLAAGLLVLAPTVTACSASEGGDPAAAGPGTSADEAAAEYAACMREHGVDLPDSGVLENGNGEDPPDEDPDFAAADEACEHLLEGVTTGDEQTGALDPQMQDALLDYAECMRAEGIDMPDPTEGGFVADGRAELPYDPESTEFQAADEECQGHLEDAGVEVTEP